MVNSSNSAPFFTGEFRHALDAKNRITIPSRWRTDENTEFFVVPHQEYPCLVAMLEAGYMQICANVTAMLPLDKKAAFKRIFASRTVNCTIDKNGRLLLSEEQCKQAGLSGEVVLVGGEDRFEIWSTAGWQDYQERNTQAYKEVAYSVGL